MSEFPPIAQLLPHGEPMIQLERLVDWSPGRAECAVRVAPTSRFVADGMLETVHLLEHMAQTVAVCLGYEAYRGGEPARVGMIVACRELRACVPRIPVGSALRIRVARVRGNDSTSQFDCVVELMVEVDVESRTSAAAGNEAGKGQVATATLTLVHGGEGAAPSRGAAG